MKQHILALLSFLFISIAVEAATLGSFALRNGCDQEYAEDAQRVLRQVSGFTNNVMLNHYLDYMLLIKRFEDLSFQIHQIESKISSAVIRQKAIIHEDMVAKLKTPAQKYNDCRNQRAYFPTTLPQSMCDRTYAANMQGMLTDLAVYTDPQDLKTFQDYMVILKHLEDARFAIHAFELRTNLQTIASLRGALTRYLSCRDTIIRSTDARLRGMVEYPF